MSRFHLTCSTNPTKSLRHPAQAKPRTLRTMQRIERYGVIALVFLLVTILAVAVWGQRKNQSLLSIFKRDKTPEVAKLDVPTPGVTAPTAGGLGLSNPTHELTPVPLQPLAPPSAKDPLLQLNAPAGPGLGAVTFDQGGQLAPGGKTNSGLVIEGAVRPLPSNTLGTLGNDVITTPAPDSGARTYKVKPGDTLGTIAQHELGSTKRWTEIAALNSSIKPERLNVGMLLNLPAGAPSSEPQKLVKQGAVATLEVSKASGAHSYSVRSGDSLSKIAAAQLGDANRFAEIQALNPGLNPAKLSVGQSLRMPEEAKAPSAVSKPKPRPASESSELAKADTAPKKAHVQ